MWIWEKESRSCGTPTSTKSRYPMQTVPRRGPLWHSTHMFTVETLQLCQLGDSFEEIVHLKSLKRQYYKYVVEAWLVQSKGIWYDQNTHKSEYL